MCARHGSVSRNGDAIGSQDLSGFVAGMTQDTHGLARFREALDATAIRVKNGHRSL